MELLQRIGSGASGEVWLARNMAIDARRAVKVIHRAMFRDERPFLREFEAVRTFELISRSDPSLLQVLQVGKCEEGGSFYYVMELADAAAGSESYQPRTLCDELRWGRLSANRVLEIALALTEALEVVSQVDLV